MSELIGEGGAAAVVGALVGGFIVGFVDLLAQLLAARQRRRHQHEDDAVDAVTRATTLLMRANPEGIRQRPDEYREARLAEIDTYGGDADAALTRVMVAHHVANVRSAAELCRQKTVEADNYTLLYARGDQSVTRDMAEQAVWEAGEAVDELVTQLHKRGRQRVADRLAQWWLRGGRLEIWWHRGRRLIRRLRRTTD